jgi:DNA (cytosine-5)-methyltransferase 1
VKNYGAYYNDNDPFVCSWLENLIFLNLIPHGIVDPRPIQEVKPSDVKGFKQCHFFAGIGGWAYALRLAGWPDNRPVWTGSCPCQPFSVAGKRKGIKDTRHLWPDFYRLISHCHPPVVFGEQVAGADGRKWISGVSTDLEKVVYAIGCADLCSPGVGAPHIRQRLWWVAESYGREQGDGELQRSREYRFFQENGGVGDGGLAESTDMGLEEWEGLREGEMGEFETVEQNGITDGLDDPSNPRRARKGIGQKASTSRDETRVQESPRRSASSGLVHPEGQQTGIPGCLRGKGIRKWKTENGTNKSGLLDCFWDSFSLIPCLDNKYRRIEPGTFPLAHGVPNRMGKLRAYGNSIVPQLAAEFIKAYMETIP